MKKPTATARKTAPPARQEQRRPAAPPAEPKRQSTAVAPSQAKPLALMADMEADAGRGVSTDAADNQIPLIYVLQPLSPQVQTGAAQIEGAAAGDIWLKNAPEPSVVDGQEGIYFMPCMMYQKWTEWVPRDKGGGFVAAYDYEGPDRPPPGAQRDVNTKNKPRFIFPETGNECIDTRYEAGIVWRDGRALNYVIPFKSTGHSISRGWMTKRNTLLLPSGKIAPSWSHVYHLTTSQRKNNQGQWHVFEVGTPVPYVQIDPAMQVDLGPGLEIIGGDAARAYQLGKGVNAAFESGTMRAAEEQDQHDDAGPADGGGDQDGSNIPY